MEEVEAMMEEINSGDDIGDDFYEKIEAPKYVDLANPDSQRASGDDRYWFCARVGCDRKHEEEMDSEAIYRNFVLRVMAARSPSVRFQKALCRTNSSAPTKSPRTVPPKSSRSRASKLAMISSIPQKALNPRPKPKQIRNANATPNAKMAQPSTKPKALTAPRNKDKSLNSNGSRSVRSTKGISVSMPRDRAVVAKALVFPSPKKTTLKLKRSVELKAKCKGMKKRELKHPEGPRKQLRGREVKSRIYNSWHPQKSNKDTEFNPAKHTKKWRKEEESELSNNTYKAIPGNRLNRGKYTSKNTSKADAGSHGTGEDVSVIKYGGSMSKQAPSADLEKEIPNEGAREYVSRQDKGGILEQALQTDSENEIRSAIENENASVVKQNEGAKDRGREIKNEQEVQTDLENEIRSDLVNEDASVLKENKGTESGGSASDLEVGKNENCRTYEDGDAEEENKENASASETNRKLNLPTKHMAEKQALGKDVVIKTPQKMRKTDVKSINDRTTTFPTVATEPVKYRKPKPTNPKPFRLRTDERGILKEANTEKKLLQAPPKEIAAVPRKPRPKHQHIGQEFENSSLKTPRRRPISLCQKTTLEDDPKTEPSSNRKASESLKRTKKTVMEQENSAGSGMASDRKKKNLVTKLNHIEEGTKANEKEASTPPKSTVFGSSSQGRKATTVPKEPNFHSIHVPKTCKKRAVT